MNTVGTEWVTPELQEHGTHLVSWDFLRVCHLLFNFFAVILERESVVKVMCKRSHLIDRENLSKNYKLSCRNKYQDRSLTNPMLNHV